ncbi:lumazine-binding domain protein [bacterium BMS3Abin03]|nr:lumazine-binding domain protein [bacterium BMS3Abin03]
MKTFKLLFSIALIAAIFALVSCGEGGVAGSSTPGDVVKTAIENIANENYDAVLTVYVTKKGKELSKEEKNKVKAFLPSAKEDLDKNDGLKEVKIINETISEDGTTAVVKAQVIYGNGKKGRESSTKLINVDGKWRIRVN